MHIHGLFASIVIIRVMFAFKNVFNCQTKAENMQKTEILTVNRILGGKLPFIVLCQKMRKGAQLVKLTSIKVILF